jgi:hypothetical protein
MTIVKSKHASNYTVLPNEIFSSGISIDAIGLLSYLLSLPHDWVIYKTNLHKQLKSGREKVHTAFCQLQEYGYIVSVQNIKKDGTYEYSHVVYDKPFNGEPNTESRTRESVHGQPPSVSRTLLSTKEPSTEILNKENSIYTENSVLHANNTSIDILPENKTELSVPAVSDLSVAKKTKKNKKQYSSFDFYGALIELGVNQDIALDWMQVREDKGAINTKTAFSMIKKQIDLTGVSANECIEMAVVNNWRGFISEWYFITIKKINPSAQTPTQDYNDKMGIRIKPDGTQEHIKSGCLWIDYFKYPLRPRPTTRPDYPASYFEQELKAYNKNYTKEEIEQIYRLPKP